jgi:hypothetical protein
MLDIPGDFPAALPANYSTSTNCGQKPHRHQMWPLGLYNALQDGIPRWPPWSGPRLEGIRVISIRRETRDRRTRAVLRPFLSKHLRRYEKSMDCFEQLAPRVPTAIENSKQIHRAQWQATLKSIDCNPGTTVHELVERLMELAEMTIPQHQAQFPIPRHAAKESHAPAALLASQGVPRIVNRGLSDAIRGARQDSRSLFAKLPVTAEPAKSVTAKPR